MYERSHQAPDPFGGSACQSFKLRAFDLLVMPMTLQVLTCHGGSTSIKPDCRPCLASFGRLLPQRKLAGVSKQDRDRGQLLGAARRIAHLQTAASILVRASTLKEPF